MKFITASLAPLHGWRSPVTCPRTQPFT